MDIKTWIFPTLCFMLFCYAMVFIGIFTHHTNPDVSLFSETKSSKGTTSIDELQKALNKIK